MEFDLKRYLYQGNSVQIAVFAAKYYGKKRDAIEKIFKEHNVEIDCIYRWERDEEREKKKKFRFV